MTRQIVLASNNAHKLTELQALLEPLQLQLRPQSDFKLDSVEETGSTFVENALIKARYAAKHTRMPAIADDSGLVVPALDGAPGVHSSRYAGDPSTDALNNQKLMRELDKFGESDPSRKAFFVAVLVFLASTLDPLPIIASGIWHGRIVRAPRGTHGFGYDPLFLPDEQDRTIAELPAATKNSLSHRARAVAEFSELMRSRF